MDAGEYTRQWDSLIVVFRTLRPWSSEDERHNTKKGNENAYQCKYGIKIKSHFSPSSLFDKIKLTIQQNKT